MSQAHYTRCGHMIRIEMEQYAQCGSSAVAIMHMPYFVGNKLPVCLAHMIEFFDRRDALEGNPFQHSEPTSLEWVYDAGTRWCPVHRWPAVLCEGWSEDEHHLFWRGTGSYSDLGRRLTST